MFDYKSPQWKLLRREALLRSGYRCECCRARVGGKGEARVDHIRTVREFPELALVSSNLRVLCIRCDAARHAEKGHRTVARQRVGLDGYPEEGL